MFDALNMWLTDRTVSEVKVEGLSLKDVMNTKNCHFLQAVRDLDRLYDTDLTGEKRAQWIRILSTPVHYE